MYGPVCVYIKIYMHICMSYTSIAIIHFMKTFRNDLQGVPRKSLDVKHEQIKLPWSDFDFCYANLKTISKDFFHKSEKYLSYITLRKL